MEMTKKIIEKIISKAQQPINVDYNGGKELAKAIYKFDKYMSNYNNQIEMIKGRYSPEVANTKILELKKDLNAEQYIVREELTHILDLEKKYVAEAIKSKLRTKEYKEVRAEALNILLKVGDKLDVETTLELIKEIIGAKDLTTLKILMATSNKDTNFIYKTAISNVEEYLNTNMLEKEIQATIQYINNPKLKGLMVDNVLHKYDIDLYNKLKNN